LNFLHPSLTVCAALRSTVLRSLLGKICGFQRQSTQGRLAIAPSVAPGRAYVAPKCC
jgi:hypothetical protein